MMIFFEEKTKLVLLIELVLSVVLALINRAWGVGFFFGIVTMIVNLVLIQRHIDGLLFSQKAHAFSNVMFYFLVNAMLGLPMLVSGLYPDKSSIVAVALGELSLKYLFYVKEIFFRKGENAKS